jgi:type III restriction enzyme
MFQLKEYQKRCLDALAGYLRRANAVGAKMAFMEATEQPYHSVPQLPGLPYVCVRVPTGGGKTVLAANAVGIAAREFLNIEQCLALWLVPTNTIREQTLDALKNRSHPYRQALEGFFPGKISVISLKEALSIQRSTLEGETVIIVSTLAALRVEDTEGRKIYESAGALQHHFSGLTEIQTAELEKVNGNGVVAYSLANILRLHRPVVIMDEAHNARTKLSFDTLARFGPSCILEFTATPDQKRSPSNVITHVSAAELKAEAMIKLPILLKTCPQWKEAVGEAVRKQGELERLAKEEEKETTEYLRPIVLFQAQPKSSTGDPVTVEVLKKCLLEDFNLPEEEIAIATGDKYEIDGDVCNRSCKTKYIITVAALKEGWDCPFAYILCSVANLGTSTAVEQILGRVLRLPKVTWKNHADLNNAYAFATSQRFTDAANSLTDALVESGFAKFEAQRMIEPAKGLPFSDVGGPLFSQPVIEGVTTAPDLAPLPKDLKTKVRFEPAKMQVVYVGPPMRETEKKALQECFKKPEDKAAVEKLCLKSNGKPCWPAAMGEQLKVPSLAVRVDGQLELFEDQFLAAPWNLADCDALLDDKEFPAQQADGQTGAIDVTEAGKIEYHFVKELHKQLQLLDLHGPKTVAALALWLDRTIDHPDIVQSQSGLFLIRLVQTLIDKRGMTMEQLVSLRFRLKDAAAQKFRDYRKQAVGKAYRQMLLPNSDMPLEVSPEVCFTFPLTAYPAVRCYEGPVHFSKHYYELPADMNGEEAACAAIIDTSPKVRYWVRNLVRDGYSFWLQTATDKFYPDFVALLGDGRYLAVEYKGEFWRDSKDTEEKKAVGDLWETRSKGACLFRVVGNDDMEPELRTLLEQGPAARASGLPDAE